MAYRQMEIKLKFPKWEIEVRKSIATEISAGVLVMATVALHITAMVFFCGKSNYAWLADFAKPALLLAVHWIIWALCFVRVWRVIK